MSSNQPPTAQPPPLPRFKQGDWIYIKQKRDQHSHGFPVDGVFLDGTGQKWMYLLSDGMYSAPADLPFFATRAEAEAHPGVEFPKGLGQSPGALG